MKNETRRLSGEIYTISMSKHTPKNKRLHHALQNDERVVAYQLYDILRYADQSQADVIVIELPPNQIKWHAIREKIIKAGRPITSITHEEERE